MVREEEEHVGGDLGHCLVVEPQRSQQHLNGLFDLGVEGAVNEFRVDKYAEAAERDAAGEAGRLLFAALEQDPDDLEEQDSIIHKT